MGENKMIVNEFIEINIRPANYKYYENLGYEIPLKFSKKDITKIVFDFGKKIFVRICDLEEGSSIKINVKCDDCGKDCFPTFSDYSNRTIGKEYNAYFCKNCANGRRDAKFYPVPEKTFGSYIIKNFGKEYLDFIWSSENKDTPFDVAYSAHSSRLFNCENKEYHVYNMVLSNFVAGSRCSYCAGKKTHLYDSVGYLYPESIKRMSLSLENAGINLLSMPICSHKKVLWSCENNIHEDYRRNIQISKNANFNCPICSLSSKESGYQQKVRIYLESMFGTDDILHEYECTINPVSTKTGKVLPYDNEVLSKKIIVEVMGKQHENKKVFDAMISRKSSRSSGDTFEKMKWRDNLKKEHAIKMGYCYISLSYKLDNKIDEWKNFLYNSILNAIYNPS